MTAIRSGDLRRFTASGCKSTRLILVHGPDEGSARVRLREMLATLLGKDADALGRVELDAETLNKDPARLLDEANAIGLFADARVIVISSASRLRKDVWLPLLEVPPQDATAIFMADDLARSSPLRAAFEKSAHCAALACYAPSAQDIQQMIDTRVRHAGLSITPTARTYLADLLGADLALSEGEIDKLVLYCQDRLAIDVADIDAMITDSSSLAGSEPIDRAFEGKLEEIEHIALRSFREGINPSGLLALALNHAILLRKLVFSRNDGALDSVMRSENIFYKRVDRVRAQATRWDLPMLAKAIDTLAAAQLQTRKAAGLDETITIRAFWAIALASRRR
jgi:DNA polymerase III subunit delta